jgi:hypothetical protein
MVVIGKPVTTFPDHALAAIYIFGWRSRQKENQNAVVRRQADFRLASACKIGTLLRPRTAMAQPR